MCRLVFRLQCLGEKCQIKLTLSTPLGALDRGWLSDADVCDWHRVQCNGDGAVNMLDFVNEGMFFVRFHL